MCVCRGSTEVLGELTLPVLLRRWEEVYTLKGEQADIT